MTGLQSIAFSSVLLVSTSGCLRLNKLAHWEDTQNIRKIEPYLHSEWNYLQLEATHTLQRVPLTTWQNDPAIIEQLHNLLNDSTELCSIKAQSALLLAKLPDPTVVLPIIDAMQICDDESRFHLMLALEILSPIDDTARGELMELSQDDDFLIRQYIRDRMIE